MPRTLLLKQESESGKLHIMVPMRVADGQNDRKEKELNFKEVEKGTKRKREGGKRDEGRGRETEEEGTQSLISSRSLQALWTISSL